MDGVSVVIIAPGRLEANGECDHDRQGEHHCQLATRGILFKMASRPGAAEQKFRMFRFVFHGREGSRGSGEVPTWLGNLFGTGGSILEKLEKNDAIQNLKCCICLPHVCSLAEDKNPGVFSSNPLPSYNIFYHGYNVF